MTGRYARNVKRDIDWWVSWLYVVAACSGFAFISLQPSITVAESHDGELVSAIGPYFELPQDQAAAIDWLADAGLVLDQEVGTIVAQSGREGAVIPPELLDMVERALAEMSGRMQPGGTPTVPSTASTTATVTPTTTTVPPTTTTTRPTSELQSSTTQAEQRFVALINQERSARELPELVVNPDVRTVARNWTATMISEGDRCSQSEIDHNDGLGDEIPTGWDSHGENVGCGQSVESLHAALMDSEGHRGNILGSDFTDVGVGVDVDANGDIWFTQVFAQY